MTVMNFPSSPGLGDEYIFNNTTYIWDGVKWVAQKPNEQNMNQLLEAHKNGIDQHSINGIHGLSDALLNAGDPVLDVKWLTKRSPMRTGYAAGDGQTLSRALYPDAIAAIQANIVPVCTDAEWLANPAKRGCFTLGDGSTTFRVPDYNGKSANSLGAMFQRGDGLNSAGVNGEIQGDAIRNIIGRISVIWGNAPIGAFYVQERNGNGAALSGAANHYGLLGFDASRVVPTAADNHPVNVTGCWAVKLFGAVQNTGSADAAALATAVAGLAARVSVLEQLKSTCLVNATGTGAPRETVVAQLPASIAINSRYVIPNPFGNSTPVICWAEVFVNGKWSRTGWIYYNGDSSGTSASYVQGEGIVVQTAKKVLVDWAVYAGGGHGATTTVTSAPCRVFVRKLEA